MKTYDVDDNVYEGMPAAYEAMIEVYGGEYCKVQDVIDELERRINCHSPFVTPVEREGFRKFLEWVKDFV